MSTTHRIWNILLVQLNSNPILRVDVLNQQLLPAPVVLDNGSHRVHLARIVLLVDVRELCVQ